MTPEEARLMAKQADKEVAGMMKTLDSPEAKPKEIATNTGNRSSITDNNSGEILELEKKNAQLANISFAISAAGGVAGALWAIHKKKKAWTVVGWFFLGSIIAGIPTGLIVRAKMINHTARIMELEQA